MENTQLFELGEVVVEPPALETLDAAGIEPEELLDRHAHADWGDVSPEIGELNELGVWYYRWITSRYPVGGECVMVITTGGRGRTTISLA